MVLTKLHSGWLLGIVVLLVLFRYVPHPPNATPMAAMALFTGAAFSNRLLAYFVPLTAMLLSDLVIGFHSTIGYVYAGVAITVLIGSMLKYISIFRVGFVAVIASIVFFLLTNFGAWLHHDIYSRDLNGLVQAYAAGLPFLRNSVLANLIFTYLLFYNLKLFSTRQKVSLVK